MFKHGEENESVRKTLVIGSLVLIKLFSGKFGNHSFICRVHHEKLWAGRSTSWNQDCREISITSNMQMTPPLWQKVKRN